MIRRVSRSRANWPPCSCMRSALLCDYQYQCENYSDWLYSLQRPGEEFQTGIVSPKGRETVHELFGFLKWSSSGQIDKYTRLCDLVNR